MVTDSATVTMVGGSNGAIFIHFKSVAYTSSSVSRLSIFVYWSMASDSLTVRVAASTRVLLE